MGSNSFSIVKVTVVGSDKEYRLVVLLFQQLRPLVHSLAFSRLSTRDLSTYVVLYRTGCRAKGWTCKLPNSEEDDHDPDGE